MRVAVKRTKSSVDHYVETEMSVDFGEEVEAADENGKVNRDAIKIAASALLEAIKADDTERAGLRAVN
jgi:hypothetical protein